MNIDTICYKKVNKDSSGNYNINCVASSGTVDQIVLNNSTLWCPSHTLSYGTSSCCCNTANKTFTVNYYNCDCVDREVSWSFCDYSGCCECKWKYHTICYTDSTASAIYGWERYDWRDFSCTVPCVGTASGSLNISNYGSSVYSNDICIPTGITLSNYKSDFSIGHSTRTYTCELITAESSYPESYPDGSGIDCTIVFNCNCLTGFTSFTCKYTTICYVECRETFPWPDDTYLIDYTDDNGFNFIDSCYEINSWYDKEPISPMLNFYPDLNCLTVCSCYVDFNCGRVYITACNRDQWFCGTLCVYCVSFDEYQYYECSDDCGDVYECGWNFLGTRCCSITSFTYISYWPGTGENWSCFSINTQNCNCLTCTYRNAKVYYCVQPRYGVIYQYGWCSNMCITHNICIQSYYGNNIFTLEALCYARRYNYTIEGFRYVWQQQCCSQRQTIFPGEISTANHIFRCRKTVDGRVLIGGVTDIDWSVDYDFTQEICPYRSDTNEIILKVVDTGPGTILPYCTLNYNYKCDGTCTCDYTCYYYCCCHYVWTTNKADIATNKGTLDETCCTCCKRQVSGSVTVNANGICTITKSYVDSIDNICTTGTIAVSRPIKNIIVECF